MPTVSICLPVYNGEKYIAEAIESALAQAYGDYEFLISDDGSRDKSLEIAQEYARRDQRIVVWSNPRNLGLFGNYNQCMKRASGKFIKLFAQDDLLAPTMLEKALNIFSAEPSVALVATSRLYIDERGEEQRQAEQLDSSRIVTGDQAIEGCLVRLHNWIGEPSAVMFPAKWIGNGFDAGYYHLGDLEYWFRILAHGNLAFLCEPLCKFRVHSEGTTQRNMKALFFVLDSLRLGSVYKDYLSKLGMDEDDYVRQVIETSAYFVHDFVRKEGITAQDSSALESGLADNSQLLKQFRELAFYALYYAHESRLRTEAVTAELNAERLAAEDKLRALQSSPIHRIGRVLKL